MRRRPRPSAAARVAVSLAVMAVVMAPILGDEGSPADAGGRDDPRLVLDRQTPWVEPDATFALAVTIEGDIDETATVEAQVFAATTSRSDFAEQASGARADDQLGESLGETGPLAIGGGRSPTIEARFATDGTPAPGEADTPVDSSGVYPVEVRLVDGDGAVLDRLVTHLVRLPGADSEAPPLNLAVVVPIDGGVGIRPDGGRRTDPVGTRRVNTLLAALDDHPDVPLTVLPTPETVVAMAGTPRLARLRRAVADRQVLSSQYVPVDVAAWVNAGLQDDLTRQTAAGEVALAERLVDRPDGRTVITDASLTPEALTRLRDLGADQVVIPAEALAPVDATAFPTTLAQTFTVQDSDGRGARSVAADAALRAHIGATDDPVLDASNVLADLAVLYFDRPNDDRGVTLTLPREWAPSPEFLDTLLGGLAQTVDGPDPVVDAVTVDELFARVPAATTGGPDVVEGEPLVRTLAPQPSAELGSYPEALPLTRLTTQGFASFAGRDNPLLASMQRRLLVSGSAALGREQRRAFLAAISSQIDNSAAAVKPPERGNITLTSRDGLVPINISNENLYDVTVRLEFDSNKLSFPDGDTMIVHLPRSDVQKFDIAVRARSSGTFPLRMTITSPDEIVLVSRSQFTVRSTAVSGVGLMLSVGAGLFLALWWASHFRKVRRARKLVPPDEAAEALAI